MHRVKKLALAIVLAPVVCLANPDGPPGSIVLLPKYSFTDADNEGGDPLSSNWVAGLGVLVPSGRYVSLAFKVEGGDVSSSVASANRSSRIRFEFSARFYIPLTKNARERLTRWDDDRSGTSSRANGGSE